MKTELYSLAQSEIVINHYKNILKDKKVGSSPDIIICDLTTEKYEDKYRIICKAKMINFGVMPILSIETALEKLNLPQPSEILKNLNP